MDYYKLLQVDSTADYEILEIAYKRMAKKYHPDVCKLEDCLEKMLQINDAYSILKNPVSRRQYDLQRMLQHNGSTSYKKVNPYLYRAQNLERMLSASACLANYLDAIKQKEYALAYSLVNIGQKKIMSFDVFRNWQHWISKVYSIVDFKVSIKEYSENVIINDQRFDFVIAFEIDVLEFNQIMEHFEKDRFIKQVIFEDDHPNIYLNQTEVSESILRYEKLAKMKIGNWQKERFKLKIHSRKTTNTFFAQLDLELERYARYSTPFSLVFFHVNSVDTSDMSLILNNLQSVIRENIRKLDAFVLIDKKTFLIMLPGTKLHEGSQFAEKICEIAINRSGFNERYFTIKRTIIENDLLQIEEMKQLIKTELEAISQSEDVENDVDSKTI